MSGKRSKKLRKEVSAQYSKQEADMRARVIEAIGEMPLWRRMVVAWRMVDKSPLVSDIYNHALWRLRNMYRRKAL